jgi:hypothetical protein
VVHRDFENSVRINNLRITAVWALCFVANVFSDSCTICLDDYPHGYTTFAAPGRNPLHHTFATPMVYGSSREQFAASSARYDACGYDIGFCAHKRPNSGDLFSAVLRRVGIGVHGKFPN